MAKKNKPITSLSPLHNAPAKPKKAPRQGTLPAPGMSAKKSPEVEAAFEDWDEASVKKKNAHTAEKLKYDVVIATMREAKLPAYKFASRDGTTVTIRLDDKTRLKVHKAKPDAFKDGGDEDEE